MNNRSVLISGVGGPAGRCATDFFMAKGYEITGLDAAAVTGFRGVFRPVPLALKPAYPKTLLEIISDLRPGLFIPTVTEELSIVAGLREKLESQGCAVFISPKAAVDVANDKLATAMFLKEWGIPAPLSFPGGADRGATIAALGLPLIAKPVFGRGGRGVAVHMTRAEALSDERPELVFQEFIPGEEYDVNLFVERDGGVAAAVALKKTEMREGIVGNAVSVQRAESPEAVESCIRAARALGLTGPLDFDVRMRADGTPAILEINARLGGNSTHAAEVIEAIEGAYMRLAQNA